MAPLLSSNSIYTVTFVGFLTKVSCLKNLLSWIIRNGLVFVKYLRLEYVVTLHVQESWQLVEPIYFRGRLALVNPKVIDEIRSPDWRIILRAIDKLIINL